MSLPSAYEVFREPVSPLDPRDLHFLEGCTPDLYEADLLHVTPDDIADLGVSHIMIDRDGTYAAGRDALDPTILSYLQVLAADERFASLSVVTDNRDPALQDEVLAISPSTRLFQPRLVVDRPEDVEFKSAGVYRRVLQDLGIANAREAVMIGDSPLYDIAPAQEVGMRTILVNRLGRRFSKSGAMALAAARRAAKNE